VKYATLLDSMIAQDNQRMIHLLRHFKIGWLIAYTGKTIFLEII
jgi:hypothetical protein